jgi:diguanylate cyclase (GGDEF)-like protein/PAS domain S-box-containing protein
MIEKKILEALPEIVDLLLDAVCVVNTEGNFVFVSAACERILGYKPEEMIGKPMISFVYEEDKEKTLKAATKVENGYLQLHFENRYVRKDKQLVHIMWSARWSPDQQLRIAVARDISERKRSESLQAALYSISEAAHTSQDLPALFEKIHRIIDSLLIATNFAVGIYNAKTDQLTFPYEAVDSLKTTDLPGVDMRALSLHVIRTEKPVLINPLTQHQLSAAMKDNIDHRLSSLIVPLKSEKGAIGTLVLTSYSEHIYYTTEDQDLLEFISMQVGVAIERKKLYEKLHHMAQYDQLTGLPNRAFLFDRLEIAIQKSQRQKKSLSLIYLDLDKFKKINDSLGHLAGDQLLQEVSQRLKSCLRTADTISRMGGDEFVVLLDDARSPEDIDIVIKKIRESVRQPIHIQDHVLYIHTSIGIATFPEHGTNAEQLLQYADAAMYADKYANESP